MSILNISESGERREEPEEPCSGRRKGKGNYTMAFNFNWALFDVLLKYIDPKPEDNLLDMGCSRGFYVKGMEAYTDNIIGVDISEASLKDAVTDKIRYGDTTNLEFADNSFDKIYSLHTVEHIPNLEDFFAEAARVLKPGGIAVIVYPWEPYRGFQATLAALRQYKNPFLCRRIHLHRLTPRRILKFVNGVPLTHIESKLVLALGVQYLTVFKKG